MANPQVIDAETIEGLRALGDDGSGEFLREIIGVYLDDAPKRIQELRDCQAAGNQEQFVRAAHSLKGSSANVGAIAVRAAAEKIEKAGRAGEFASQGPAIDGLAPLVEEARRELEALLPQA